MCIIKTFLPGFICQSFSQTHLEMIPALCVQVNLLTCDIASIQFNRCLLSTYVSPKLQALSGQRLMEDRVQGYVFWNIT